MHTLEAILGQHGGPLAHTMLLHALHEVLHLLIGEHTALTSLLLRRLAQSLGVFLLSFTQNGHCVIRGWEHIVHTHQIWVCHELHTTWVLHVDETGSSLLLLLLS